MSTLNEKTFVEKFKSGNYLTLSLLLHSTAILAIAMGPTLFPELMEKSGGDRVEVEFISENTDLNNDLSAKPMAPIAVPVEQPKPVVAAAPKIEPKIEPKVEAKEVKIADAIPVKAKAEPKPVKKVAAKKDISKSTTLPEKMAQEIPPEEKSVEKQPEEQIDSRYDVLAEESPIKVDDQKEKLQAKLEQEELARKAKEQADQDELLRKQEATEQLEVAKLAAEAERQKILQERAELEAQAIALAEAKEKAKEQAEQLAAENAMKMAAAEQARQEAEEAKALAAQELANAEAEKAKALAASAAAAEQAKAAEARAAQNAAKMAAQNQNGQGSGSGAGKSTVAVKQNFLELRQAAGNEPPSYTRDMRINKLEGRGQLVYFVNKHGQVTDMRLNQSTGSSELDQAAIDAFKKYKFVPGQEGYTVHNFEFRLSGPAQAEDGRLRALK